MSLQQLLSTLVSSTVSLFYGCQQQLWVCLQPPMAAMIPLCSFNLHYCSLLPSADGPAALAQTGCLPRTGCLSLLPTAAHIVILCCCFAWP